MSDFLERMKNFAEKGLEVSKDALGKAGDTMQSLGKKGAKKIELAQLNHQVQKEFTALGIEVYDLLTEGGKESISTQDDSVSALLEKISRLKADIEQKESDAKKA